jgi:hypothetical protein
VRKFYEMSSKLLKEQNILRETPNGRKENCPSKEKGHERMAWGLI